VPFWGDGLLCHKLRPVAFMTTHLASWGFVVASVDYLERGLRRQFDLNGSLTPDPELDEIVEPERTANAFAAASAPARHVVIEAMGHLGPSDICAIGENGGGVIQIALDQGLRIPPNLVRLGTDGCQEGALPPPDGWLVINHFVTSQLRWAFGFDEEPVGLSQDAEGDLPEAMFTYEESL